MPANDNLGVFMATDPIPCTWEGKQYPSINAAKLANPEQTKLRKYYNRGCRSSADVAAYKLEHARVYILSDEDVEYIRRHSAPSLAERFNVSANHIRQIWSGRKRKKES